MYEEVKAGVLEEGKDEDRWPSRVHRFFFIERFRLKEKGFIALDLPDDEET